jgi:carbamoyl-phosphate synthase large subunit
MEVVRDNADNCIIVCSIENIDAMGVHTGDSITVAPALTLTDKEYQIMRDASFAVLREIGVDTGGSNVQFAVNPDNGRMVVIEMNPRVSRSSALASKATGFPIAKVAAKLAVGYTLDEIKNDVTKVTPASFEPTIDYIVTKIPRFTFEKFPGTEPILTTAMKSVGEAMAMGRNFAESLQKALRSLETGLTGLNDMPIKDLDDARSKLAMPTPDRLLVAAQALRMDMSVEDICAITKYDPWFVRQLNDIVNAEKQFKALVASGMSAEKAIKSLLEKGLHLKKMGFSDARLAELAGIKTQDIAAARKSLKLHPVYKRVDTCAGEFDSNTPYMYSTYEGDGLIPASCESEPTNKTKVIILGGGPNRIGQGIEFDYCCVHAAYALKEAGYETIMVNCNPETVSTDYDTSDRLYFEPLTAEDVLEVIAKEQSNGTLKGVIVQFGGQTPLKLARALEAAGVPIIGTSPDSIDLAEDRDRFRDLVEKLGLKQPKSAIGRTASEVVASADDIGFPLLVRPSYVLGGRAMAIMHDKDSLGMYVGELTKMFGDGPILIDSYLQDAIELDVDALSDGTSVHVAGIMQHIEEAGIHSGDSACSLPPYSLDDNILAKVRTQTHALAKALNVIGLMNIQFAVKDDELYLIEVNPRASRTVPFVAKSVGYPVAKIAARIMAGEKLASFNLDKIPVGKHVSVKEAVFPFARFPGVDVILGPEMKSTGEAMGIDVDFARAFAKSQLSAGSTMPQGGTLFVSVKEADKPAIVASIKELLDLGFKAVATRGTAEYLKKAGLDVSVVNKVREGRPHIVDMLKDNGISLVINTTEGSESVRDSFSIRRTALLGKIPYYTTLAGAKAAAQAIAAMKAGSKDGSPNNIGGLDVKPIQAYFSK